MEIRPAKEADIEKIWEIEKESRTFHTKIISQKFEKLNKSHLDFTARSEFMKNLSPRISDNETIFLVAEDSCKVIAWIISKIENGGGLTTLQIRS